MIRIALTDESGRWFDQDSAEAFEEDTDWNGNNNISRATKTQWDHEKLYRTASGKWVLHTWSQRQGVLGTYMEIDDEQAAAWLVVNGHESDIVDEQIKKLEL